MKFHSIKDALTALGEGSTWAGITAAITAGVSMPHPYHIPVMLGGVMAVLLKDPASPDKGSDA